MRRYRPRNHVAGLACGLASLLLVSPIWAETPSAEQALALTPIQQDVDYARTSREVARQCQIRAEKVGGVTAWVVRDPQGQMLRRFADTNADNVVDLWCYYQDGREVYRDIDGNFNGKADQYRWFHTGGTRWGIDNNEDGQIDAWRVISAPELAEQLVLALKTRDRSRFQLLLLTAPEVKQLGVSRSHADSLAKAASAAASRFDKLAAQQEVIRSDSRYVDFGGARPATIPAGTDGSTSDYTIRENVSALVETGGKHEQVYLGTIVAVGDAWKLLDLPALGSDSEPSTTSGLLVAASGGPAGNGSTENDPSEEMQRLMADLERLDRQADSLPPAKQGPITQRRAELLEQLAEISPDRELREQWYRQLADMLSVAVQTGGYPQGMEQLGRLQQKLAVDRADRDILAHTVFQRMWAEYVLRQQTPDADAAKVQEQWLADLEDFTKQYPSSPDSAEAMLQLGMYQEFVGETAEAQKWYAQLVKDFADSSPSAKARGAIRRLTSVGKPIRLQGPGVGGGTVDLADYRGKIVLVHYWATWNEQCKEDMQVLKDLYARYGGRQFDIIGVSLDDSRDNVRAFLSESRLPWKQIHESGGLDGRLANEMGVTTVPLLLLVDDQGKVIDDNIYAIEVEAELKRLLR